MFFYILKAILMYLQLWFAQMEESLNPVVQFMKLIVA